MLVVGNLFLDDPNEPQSKPQTLSKMQPIASAEAAQKALALQPEVQAHQPGAQAKQPEVQAQQPEAQAKQPEVQAQQPEAQAKQPEVQAQQPEVQAQHPGVEAESQLTKSMLTALQALKVIASKETEAGFDTNKAATDVFAALKDEQAAQAFKAHGGAQTLVKIMVDRNMEVEFLFDETPDFGHVLSGLSYSEQGFAALKMLARLRCRTSTTVADLMLAYFIQHSDACAEEVAEADGMVAMMSLTTENWLTSEAIISCISNLVRFPKALHTFVAGRGIEMLTAAFDRLPSLCVVQNICKCLRAMAFHASPRTSHLIKQKAPEVTKLFGEALWWLINTCAMSNQKLHMLARFHACVSDLLHSKTALDKTISAADADTAGATYDRCAWTILQTSDKWPSVVLQRACRYIATRSTDGADGADGTKGSDALITNHLIEHYADAGVFVDALKLHVRCLKSNTNFRSKNAILSKENFAAKLIFYLRNADTSFDDLKELCGLVPSVHAEPFVKLGGIEALFGCLDVNAHKVKQASPLYALSERNFTPLAAAFLNAVSTFEKHPSFWGRFEACNAVGTLTNLCNYFGCCWYETELDTKELARDILRRAAMRAAESAEIKTAAANQNALAEASAAKAKLEEALATAKQAQDACMAKDEKIRELARKNEALTVAIENVFSITEALQSSTINESAEADTTSNTQ